MNDKPVELLARYVHSLHFDAIPPKIIESAKLLVLDYLASAIAGYKINKVFNEATYKVIANMGGRRESSVLFQGGKLPAPTAALINAVYGHGADIDDGHRLALGHPGVVVIPTVLALAEAHRLNGREALVAIVAGYDLFVRIAAAINPYHMSRGFHTTGTVGTIAGAGAAAKALNLSPEQTRHAISLATLQSAGLLEVMENGQMAKPFHPGKAAFNAILAARLAYAGAEGPEDALGGRNGFFRAFAGEINFDALSSGLGRQFHISSCYVKLYPSCRHTHGAIDAALDLRRKNGGLLQDVEKVRVHVYPAAINLTGTIREPRNEDEAKFSLVYAVATALTKGHFNLNDLNMAGGVDRETRAMAAKVEIINDAKLENREMNLRGTKIELLYKDERVNLAVIDLPKGDPENPVTRQDLEVKLNSCADGLFSLKRQEAIMGFVDSLESLESIDYLTKLFILRPQARR